MLYTQERSEKDKEVSQSLYAPVLSVSPFMRVWHSAAVQTPIVSADQHELYICLQVSDARLTFSTLIAGMKTSVLQHLQLWQHCPAHPWTARSPGEPTLFWY